MQKEILAHGRLYISRQFICFYANIFGWETTVRVLLFSLYLHASDTPAAETQSTFIRRLNMVESDDKHSV